MISKYILPVRMCFPEGISDLFLKTFWIKDFMYENYPWRRVLRRLWQDSYGHVM